MKNSQKPSKKSNNPLKSLIKNKQTSKLVKGILGIDITKGQEQIINSIIFQKKEVVISAHTRYGKSYAVAIAVVLYLLFKKGKTVNLIAPQKGQAQILRNYIAEFLMSSEITRELLNISNAKEERVKKEISKTRMTFKNTSELRVMSAEGTGDRLMGWGGDLIICDEDCLISYEVYRQKISRMKGDSPDSKIVHIGNPWNRDNQMFETWQKQDAVKIKIDYKQGINEGQVTEQFIEEQRYLLTPLEFTILYEANFPKEAEDSLFNLDDIEKAENTDFGFKEKLELRDKVLSQPFKYSEPYVRKIKKEAEGIIPIMSCDVADKGMDETAILIGYRKENYYEINKLITESKSEPMNLAGRLMEITEKYNIQEIYIDEIGIGAGVVSRVREAQEEKQLDILVKNCHFGEKAIDSDRHINKKSENYFRAKDLFQENQISLNTDDAKIKQQLTSIKWELTSSGKAKIVDPEEKSPDRADALVYFIWKDNKQLEFEFI